MILSILIPTLPEPHRILFLKDMVANLNFQISALGLNDQVEIIIDDRDHKVTTGEKRNDLMDRATGKYTWYVDEDDYLFPYAIEEIIEASKKDPDVICFNGFMTTDGKDRVDFELRLGHPYCATQRDGKEFYLRFPNHIVPMKREKIKHIRFRHVTLGEDYPWAQKINDLGLLKTQEIIDKDIYHYRCRSVK